MLGRRGKDEEVRLPSDEVEEEYSFDDFAKGIATKTVSRGRALKLAGAAFLSSAAVLPFVSESALAKHKKKKKKKKKGAVVCPPAKAKCINTQTLFTGCCPKGTVCCPAQGRVFCCPPTGVNVCNLLNTNISACIAL